VRIEVGTFVFPPGEETCIRYTAKYTEEREVIAVIFVSGTNEGKFKDRFGKEEVKGKTEDKKDKQ
jgi:hypothetical protein